MTSNTKQRLISALVLAIILIGCVIWGQLPMAILIGVVGLLVTHEVYVNILKQSYKSKSYWFNLATYLVVFFFIIFEKNNEGLFKIFNNAGLILNSILIYYLFFTKNETQILKKNLSKYRYAIGGLVVVLSLNLVNIIFVERWQYYLWGLVILNFSVDSAAWFFGKTFGRNKLWEAVSPKKTIEGAIGGVLTSMLLATLYWAFAIGDFKPQYLLFFLILACFAQVGDLIQSKIKRNFDVKDTSNLIPGHGGVYDRIDSLYFVTPFFILFLL